MSTSRRSRTDAGAHAYVRGERASVTINIFRDLVLVYRGGNCIEPKIRQLSILRMLMSMCCGRPRYRYACVYIAVPENQA